MSLSANPFNVGPKSGTTLDTAQKLPISKITRPVGAPKTRLSQFGLEHGRLLNDDYVHKKFLTVKYAGKGSAFIVNGKGTLDFKVGGDKREVPVTSSEVKIITNIDGRNLETRFDNRGGIRLWGNFGTYTLVKPLAVTAKFKTNSAFSAFSGNVACEYQGVDANITGRLELKNGNVPYLAEKFIYNYNRFQVGFASKVNLSSFAIARYNVFASYTERDFSILAEHVSRNRSKVELGKLILAGIYRRGGNDYVLKASYRPHKADQLRVKLGAVANINKDTVLRAKINNNTKFTLSTKFKYNSNLTLVAASQVQLLDPSTFFTNKTIPIPLGLSLEFNYA